jgi:hypothetical protein
MMGNKLFRNHLRRVSAHEAGHFVLCVALPDQFLLAKVKADLMRGYVRFTKHERKNFHSLVCDFTGLAAEKILRRAKNVYRKHRDSQDMINARNTAFKIVTRKFSAQRLRRRSLATIRLHGRKMDEVMEAGRIAAERFVRANRKQIAVIARTLIGIGGREIDSSRLLQRLEPLPPLTALPPSDKTAAATIAAVSTNQHSPSR